MNGDSTSYYEDVEQFNVFNKFEASSSPKKVVGYFERLFWNIKLKAKTQTNVWSFSEKGFLQLRPLYGLLIGRGMAR